MIVDLQPVVALTPSRSAQLAGYGLALTVAAALGHFLLGLPIQVSDSFGNMLQLSASWSDLLRQKFTQPGFLRPLLWGELKAIYDLSGGNYTVWFRWAHVVQGVALAMLFVALVRTRTWRDAVGLPSGFAVLLGMHTFAGTVTEAFPSNMYLTVVIACVAAGVVAFSSHRWWNDVLAVLLFLVAVLTLETGLLVWVVCAGAALLGARGLSRAGLAVMTGLLGVYFAARFFVLGVGSPSLLERSSGFGFTVLDPPELVARFGDNPLPFYTYNVVASLLSVLVSEPRSGVYRAAQALTAGHVPPATMVAVAASLGAVALLARMAWLRRGEWRARRFDHDDRLVLLFGMVLVANAAISYPYTKDVIMAPAGVFLAAAVAAAARHLYTTIPARATTRGMVMLTVALAVLTSAWSVRALGLHGQLRAAAITERLDWAYIESDIAEGVAHAPDASARALLEQLRGDALIARPAPPPLDLPFYSLAVAD